MFRRCNSLLCFVLLASLAQAQTEPGILEAARKDLQDIKASKADSGRTRVELPSISGPGLQAASGPQPKPWIRENKRAVSGRSENWLLDAMAGIDERAEEERLLILTGEKTETELELEKRFRWPGERIEQTPSVLPKKSADRERDPTTQAATVENPLTAFMGDWISQRDHALLLPKAASGPAGISSLASLPASSDYQGAVLPGRAGYSRELTAATSNAFSFTSRPVENPYLQTLLPAMPESSAMRPDTTAFGQPRNDLPAPSFRRQSEPPAPAGKPVMPVDLAKPDEDKKYFPQLKRF